MMRSCTRIAVLVLITSILVGCSWTGDFSKEEKQKQSILRIGVTANYPPFLFKTYGKLLGAEVDLARLLGQALGTEVDFVEEGWEDLDRKSVV